MKRLLSIASAAACTLVASAVVTTVQAAGAPTESAQVPAVADRMGTPVTVNGHTLFVIRGGLFTFTEADRATTIAARVTWLATQTLQRIRATAVADEGTITVVVSEDVVIMTVTAADATMAGRSRQDLAGEYAAAIRTAAETLNGAYNARTVALGALFTLLATVLLVVVLTFLRVASRRVHERLDAWHGSGIRPSRPHQWGLPPADRAAEMLHGLARLTRAAITLALLYGYGAFTLSQFPWTREYASRLDDYFLSPLRTIARAGAGQAPDILFLLVVIALAYVVIKAVKFVFSAISKETIRVPGFYPDWAESTYKIVRFLILTLVAIVVFHYLPGSNSPAFEGVSLFVGFLVSLGSTAAIAHAVAGGVLTYTRAFQVGDRVQIGDSEGDVLARTLLVTRIRTIKNVDVAIPNAVVLAREIINYSSSAPRHGLILHTVVTIGYDVPWRTVHQLLIEAALATNDVLKDPAPYVLQKSLDDFYARYELNAYTDKPTTKARTYSELHQNIQDKLHEGGVEILSPHYSALRDGNATVVPSSYLPNGYTPPSFRVTTPDRAAIVPSGRTVTMEAVQEGQST